MMGVGTRRRHFECRKGGPYTKGSLTDTTKTLPEEASFGCLRNPGTWELEHEGPCGVKRYISQEEYWYCL